MERELRDHEARLDTTSMFLEGQTERLTDFMQRNAITVESHQDKLLSLVQKLDFVDSKLRDKVKELQDLLNERTQIEIGEIELPPEESEEEKPEI